MVLRPLTDRCQPEVFELRRDTAVVGAGSGADLIIAAPTVSRVHAELQLVPEGVRIRDLNSRNGTYYLGHRVEEMILGVGAQIRLGSVALDVEFDSRAFSHAFRQSERYGHLLGRSVAMQRLFGMLERLEGSLLPLLVIGESGTGKELVAKTVHERSSVAGGPLVALNCGAIQRELVQSELFGHRKGAFTGALEHRVGAFEAADGGTLFLDEIGELPLDVQPVLLRALQERTVVRLGETNPRPYRARLIAATNRDLKGEVQAGRFREDLYYRLKAIQLEVPPLRERPDDIELLALDCAQRAGAVELPQDVLGKLRTHHWPGNVRELLHSVEAYCAIGILPHVEVRSPGEWEATLTAFIDVSRPHDELKQEFLDSFQRAYLKALLAKCGGNVSQAARISGMERSHLNKLVNRLGVKR